MNAQYPKAIPKLYGLELSNRSGSGHFTKNCFNSSFPVALALYMSSKSIGGVGLKVNDKGEIFGEEVS